jgi:hypothetical protein
MLIYRSLTREIEELTVIRDAAKAKGTQLVEKKREAEIALQKAIVRTR